MKHHFLEPIRLGNVEVKNRVIFMAMAKAMSGFDGVISRRDIDYIASVAKGGVGLVIPGAMNVDEVYPSIQPLAPSIFSDKFLPGVKLLVKAAHDNGAKILIQLWHGGQIAYGSDMQLPTVNDLSVEEIRRIQAKFVDAAKRAMAAGADGVEFQMCHTYLANQFMSPLWNHRTDEYGCDTPENGARFSVEVLKQLREVIGPDKILAVKLQGFDFPEGEGIPYYGSDGIQPELAAKYAVLAEQAGADLITVSAGGTLAVRDDIMTGDVHRAEGWKVPAAAIVKKAVSIPVAASGSIRHPEFVDQIIEEGKCDMVGMARGILAERNWVKKCEEGRENELRYCISCMNCWNVKMFQKDQSCCSVNPYALREEADRPLVKNGDGRVVAIVGAGPTGMEAAVTLKQRGFEPVVFEKSNRIGGHVHVAKKPPYKGKFDWACGYYANMAEVESIDVRLGEEATVEKIMALQPYAVLIAAGSEVTVPPIPGVENCLQSRKLLDEGIQFENKKMAVIGGGITGLETALYLKAQGNDVCIVDFAPEFPLTMGGGQNYSMEAKLETLHCKEQGIPLYYEHKVNDYTDGKLTIESVAEATVGEQRVLEVEEVILSTGVKACDELFFALYAAGQQRVFKAGDANVPAKISDAVQAGNKFAIGLN
ncbi:MAG: FAD-dependent oxidoreductase [Oscillospiraceae bacterium]|nr:FAD-dependent oxidoreductase [Oscillospiraceae bacterium]